MFHENIRWWCEEVATSGAPDTAFCGEEIHLYGRSRRQLECFVRCGTPDAPEFIRNMDDDEFQMLGLRNTLQTARLQAWLRAKNADA